MSNEGWKNLLQQGVPGGSSSVNGNDLLNKFMGSGVGGGLLGGVLAGGLTGLMAGKGGKKFAKSALKLGGAAAVGGLAYAAYSRYRQRSAAAGQAPAQSAAFPASAAFDSPPTDSGFLPPSGETAAQSAMGLAIIRAMIAAAKADGHIDDTERGRIFEQIKTVDLSADEKAFLLEELASPLDIDAIVKLGVTPEVSTELYAASLLAADPDTPAEKAYLQMLAARLGLEQALVDEIHETVLSATRQQ